MASRCISTLNDLDKISKRIYHKHSKERFRAGIEAKLKASRDKADRSLREVNEGSSYRSCKTSAAHRSSVGTSSVTLSSRLFSASASTRSTTSEHYNKVVKEKTKCKQSTSKSTDAGKKERIERRETKSCPSHSVDAKVDKKKDKKIDVEEVPRAMSVFGKYNGKGSEYKPTAWFNFPQETSVGVIDSFVCDAVNEKPVCYSINVKKGETVPNLLQHNLEVRVGQNGVIRTQRKKDTVMSEVCQGDARQGKKRTAPLSWEEQLQWHDACVISAEAHTDKSASSENLCETHPVVFHATKPREQEKCSKGDEVKNHSSAYKVGLESRWVYPDRRNLLSSAEKCIISVEVEDTRSGDRKDSSEGKFHTLNLSGNETTQDFNLVESISKKVSFEDEGTVTSKTITDVTEKDLSDKSTKEMLEEDTKTSTKVDDTRKSNFQPDVAGKARPKTSHERSRKDGEEATMDIRKLRRPHTAPAAPPSSPRVYFDSRLNNCVPIKIPTSQGEVENSSSFLSVDNQESEEKDSFIELNQSSSSEDENENDYGIGEDCPTFSIQVSPSSCEKGAFQGDGATPIKRVTFCKSAPIVRTVPRLEKAIVPRARSSSSNRPPQPIVIEAETALELPKHLPPAQALVALRKKIRDDLAHQNHELQLDIQQLYLRKHLE